MENVYDCHSASRSSSWKRLFGESALYQKSTTTNSVTIVRCEKELTTELMFVGSLNRLIQIGIGTYECMVLSLSHAKLSACVQPIKAATTGHGSTWNSSIGAVPNHITKNMTDEFYSKSVLRHVPKGNRKSVSVKS